MAFFVLLIASWIAGSWALRRVDIASRAEGMLYKLLTGLALCALMVLVAGSFALSVAQAIVLLFAVVGLGAELFLLRNRDFGTRSKPARERLAPMEWVSWLVIVGAQCITLIGALAPATSWDSGVAHLALPAAYTREGRMVLLEGNAYSAYPHLVHSLYTVAFRGSGEWGVQMLSWFFGVLGSLAAFVLGRRVLGRRVGLIAAAFFATAPVFFDQAGAVSIDVAFTTYTLAALAALYTWHEKRDTRWLAVAAVLAGSACGIRHTGYLVCILLTAGVLVWGNQKRIIRTGMFAVMGLCAALPWLVRSALLVGNPVYPFFLSYFSKDVLPDVEVAQVGSHFTMHGTGLIDLLLFPYNLIMRPYWYDGWSKSPGGALLVFAPLGVLLGGRRVWPLVLYGMAGGVCFFYFQQVARYMLPFFAAMMVVAAAGTLRLNRLKPLVNAVLVVLWSYGLVLGMATVWFKVPVAFGMEDRDAYLTRRVDRYEAFKWVNENIPHDAVVYTLDPRSYFLHGRSYHNFMALTTVGRLPLDAQLKWLRERDIQYILIPVTYVTSSERYREIGILDPIEQWRADRQHFRLQRRFELNTGGNPEIVELYEVLYPDNRD